MLKAEYLGDKNLIEEGLISYITSAGYKAEYWFTYVKSCIKRMVQGDKSANFLALDYLISIFHNIKTEQMVRNEMSDMDSITIQLEYLNIPSGSSGKAYFKPAMFPRVIKKAFYPLKDDAPNNKSSILQKADSEIRVISIDVATRANKANDNSAISLIQCIPKIGKGYERRLLYQEVYKGKNTTVQAKRIKQLHREFEADWIVIDMMGPGTGVFDSLTQVTTDEDRGINYHPMTVADFDWIDDRVKEDMQRRTLGVNALPIVIPILASSQLNSQIAVAFRSSLQRKLWQFLIGDAEAEEYLAKNNKSFIMDNVGSDDYIHLMNPYINTTFCIGEAINLDYELRNGLIRLDEKVGSHKDRYTSVSYANYFISILDQELIREVEESEDDFDTFMRLCVV